MSYLPSGTTYPSTVSTFAPGLASGGQDFVATVNATSGTTVAVSTSQIFHNVSGISNYLVSATTPATFQVVDVFGKAASATITVSGSATQTINGTLAGTKTLTTNYGKLNAINTSTNTWVIS